MANLPASDTTQVQYALLSDSLSVSNNPLLAYVQKQKDIAIAQTALQSARLKPELFAGYFNNSFRGTGADNKSYNAGHRFHSAQVGVAVPIFSKNQKQKVKAYKIAEQVAESDYRVQSLALQAHYASLLSTYQNNRQVWEYYQQKGLANATLIKATANKQFAAGEINYLDWVNIVHQAINTQLNYVETLKALNNSIIDINYLQNK